MHWQEIEPVTEAKKKALLVYKRISCSSTCDALRAARIKAQQDAHCCTKDYWLNLCNKIQNAADTRNAKRIYNGIKKTTDALAT